jgi:hypothetical protein
MQFVFKCTSLFVWRQLLALAVICCLPSRVLAELPMTTVVIPPWGVGANPHNTYFIRVLNLVFAKTEESDGPVDIKISAEKFSSMRFMSDLKNGVTVDLVWYATSKQREQDLLPIKISLTKDLNEYRVLLIRKEDQEKFSQLNSLNDLRKFTAGAGADWPSGDILRNNGMPIITVNNGNLLFTMLKAKRIDWRSRILLPRSFPSSAISASLCSQRSGTRKRPTRPLSARRLWPTRRHDGWWYG